jgi:hypothetical protein
MVGLRRLRAHVRLFSAVVAPSHRVWQSATSVPRVCARFVFQGFHGVVCESQEKSCARRADSRRANRSDAPRLCGPIAARTKTARTLPAMVHLPWTPARFCI